MNKVFIAKAIEQNFDNVYSTVKAFSTFEKAVAGMKAAVEDIKEIWVVCELVENEDEIKINEEEDSCTLESCDGYNFDIFKIEEIELDKYRK